MSSSASDDEDAPPQGARGVLSAPKAVSALLAEALAIYGALWNTKEFLPFKGMGQLFVLYLAILALSAMIAFALARVNRRTKLRGVFASGAATSVLLLTLAVLAASGSSAIAAPAPGAGAPASSATPTATPTPTSTPVDPPSPTPAPASPRPAPGVATAAPPRSTGCQERLRYRVTADADIMDADKRVRGRAKEGEMFVLLEEPVHVDYRRYGTVGGYTGYVLMTKLEPAGTVCV
jgi:hypothetical protein